MTKCDLERIRESAKRINQKKLELEALRYKASGAGAIRYDKDRVQTTPQNYMEMAIADVIEIEKQIEEEEAKVEVQLGKAYSAVRKMEQPDQRAVIEWYYLNGLSMIDTAGMLNMSERNAYYLREDAIEAFVLVKL